MKIVKIEDPKEKSHICEKGLRSLPQWFGIESAILDYIKVDQTMETKQFSSVKTIKLIKH